MSVSALYSGFIVLTVVTLLSFYWLTGKRTWVVIGGIAWLAFAALLAANGFFEVIDVLPPRLGFLIVPLLAGGVFVGFSARTKAFRAGSSLRGLHYFHAVRIGVELVFLHGLYEAGTVARALTYEGWNFDIVPGVLLPVIGWLVFQKGMLSRKWAVVANVAGILILGWTVVVAVLSTATSYQQFGFGQPTTAIFYFPLVWLPALVAPLMFWAHFIVLGRLRDERGNIAP